jgi:hypothetical protein
VTGRFVCGPAPPAVGLGQLRLRVDRCVRPPGRAQVGARRDRSGAAANLPAGRRLSDHWWQPALPGRPLGCGTPATRAEVHRASRLRRSPTDSGGCRLQQGRAVESRGHLRLEADPGAAPGACVTGRTLRSMGITARAGRAIRRLVEPHDRAVGRAVNRGRSELGATPRGSHLPAEATRRVSTRANHSKDALRGDVPHWNERPVSLRAAKRVGGDERPVWAPPPQSRGWSIRCMLMRSRFVAPSSQPRTQRSRYLSYRSTRSSPPASMARSRLRRRLSSQMAQVRS